MAREAEDELTTHELMAKSGHKSLPEVERYTKAARKKKLADAAKSRAKRARMWPRPVVSWSFSCSPDLSR